MRHNVVCKQIVKTYCLQKAIFNVSTFDVNLWSQTITDMYPAEIVIPMKAELTDSGFDEMVTAKEVDDTLQKEGTTLVVINSVCGCAAGACRPGVLMAVHNAGKRPDRLTTSFAGFDVEAVNQVRAHLLP